MRTRYFLILTSFFLLSLPAYGQWTTVSPDAIIHHFRSSDFVDGQTGFVAGWIGISSGTGGVQSVLVRTTDGGGTWESETVSQVEVNAIHAFDADNAIGAGRGYHCNCPTLVRTTDGGRNWEEENFTAFTGSFMSMDFYDAERGIVGGGNPETGEGFVLRTIDGGATFQPVFLEQGGHVARLVMVGPGTAYAIAGAEAGAENTIYKSVNVNDFQENVLWEPVKTFAGFVSVTDLDFVSADHGFLLMTVFDAGDFRGEVWETADGGTGWANKFSSLNYTLTALDFLDGEKGLAVGENSVILTTDDGGANWSEDITRVTGLLSGVEFVNPGIAYAVGTDGTIMKYDQSSAVPDDRLAESARVRLEVVPAPVTDRAAVRIVGAVPGTTYRLLLSDAQGRQVMAIELKEGQGTLQTEALPSGAYFYRLLEGERGITTGGIVVR